MTQSPQSPGGSEESPRIGATATVLIRAHQLDLSAGGSAWTHDRQDHTGKTIRLPEHRRAVLAVVHGERKKRYFRRQCLLELGPPAHDLLEQLVHRCPGGTWSPHVDRLFELLCTYGSQDLIAAITTCAARSQFDARAIEREIRRAA